MDGCTNIVGGFGICGEEGNYCSELCMLRAKVKVLEAECDSYANSAIGDVLIELDRASSSFAPFNSAHEGYAVLLEEVDELWDEVKKSPKKRDPARLRAEAVQVAAMALRFIVDVCDR